MQLKELYKYNNGRQLFRLLPTDTGKLVIEERDRTIKEVFFSCLDVCTGRIIFSDLQFDEKYWIGIQKIYKDVILFHRFERPDLPGHKGIIAYDIKSQTILWENKNSFLYTSDDRVVFMTFENGIKSLIAVDYLSGEPEPDGRIILTLEPEKEDRSSYIHSKKISRNNFEEMLKPELKKKFSQFVIKDEIHFANKSGLKFFSFHQISEIGKYDNRFFAIDDEGTILLEETLNKGIEKLEPESFFIKDDLLFLLFGSSGFGVYQIN
ncbi:DUF4905 domain-containing protein [Ignavibacterium sp.]|uniref:DUF4905 domain-containing protein n=1 Tax=Ignavibacterium sp. TaxID=2651167 RepID=UPI00307F7A2C